MSGPAIPPKMGLREIMPAEGYIDQSGGWDDLAEQRAHPVTDAHAQLLVDERQAAAQAAAVIFETPSLRPLLEYVADCTLRANRAAHTAPGIDPTHYAFDRLGQNKVAMLLWQLVAQGRGEIPPHQREGL